MTRFLTGCTEHTTVLHPSESQTVKLVKPNKAQAAHYNVRLGLAYLKVGDMRRAHYKLNKAIELDPGSAEAHYAFAYYSEQLGEVQQARQEYLIALRLAPNDPKVLNNYGTFLCKQGDLKESIHYLLAAAEQRDYLDRSGSYENAGLCAVKMSDLKRAEDYFRRALQLSPHSDRILWELIKISDKQGQDQQTLLLLKRYLLARPHDHNARSLLDKLQARLVQSNQS
ncbi:type IV pilus biogenesis/stability protein PilW [Piscirickettsia litoralis]|uniref:type IV pilus biogenesis/stability protein PilW n=1 Tax=Piscirickettsia litoralis TaxID=1891921 RepID=UPI001F22AEFD|nr:type IV pilus biogenesis/stability protein PilW [Piscirickettsia litoralis]